MDEYGGPAAPPRPPKPLARVHRPSGAAAAAAARQPTVSLLRPRPEAERERNAYVEAPRRAHRPPAPPPHPAAHPLKPVTAQPSAAALDKRRAPLPDSIVCEACGRCRCEQCARPRPLPERWVCGSCLCSAEACVDYASCMCCVKALFYHCGSGEEEAGEPCACGGARAAARLGCVGALALALPCLFLYWPLRGCAAAGAALYARCRRAGCRCPESVAAPQ
ncbi:Protein sprouty [Eumeta japonica]|uniref:Protein sprouty n=1 Tax=Eumeta variegata TaxID=151549 RepID=A0A4C1WCK6_EUMVA|nr:Protein sprouty [Eumeta japonica]